MDEEPEAEEQEYIVLSDGVEFHALPDNHMGHLTSAWCWCRPEIKQEDLLTGKKLYEHRVILH